MKRLALLLTLASPAAAQDFAVRSSDTLPSEADLRALILDRDLIYFDDGTSRYNTDGSYAWTYSDANGGSVWDGTHTITENVVCVTFTSGTSRCDMFVTSNDRLTLLTEDGDRYPIREIR